MANDVGRLVTLIVVDSDGAILGQTDERADSVPHWQEASTLSDLFPGAVILRLLDVTQSENDGPDKLTYLAQYPTHSPPNDLATCTLDAQLLSDHPFRMPWAQVNGPLQDINWAKQHIQPSGDPTQIRSWNLSSVWSIPASINTVWLKCVPSFFKHEGHVLQLLAGANMPKLIAFEDHRILLENMPGKDGYCATDEERFAGIEQLVSLQRKSTTVSDELISAGVPVVTLPEIANQCVELLHKRGVSENAAHLIESLPDRLAVLADSDIATVLVHGDFHAGNMRIGVNPPIVFDWGDSFMGHPFLDMVGLPNKTLIQQWLSLWQSVYPDENVVKLWKKIRPLSKLRTALVYQNFLNNIEPTEQVYHEGDVDEIILDVLGEPGI